MRREKLEIYIFEIIMIIFLFFILFASSVINRMVLALILVAYCMISHFLFKRKSIKSIYEKKTLILMIIFGVIYVALFYLLGLYFGFEKNKYIFNLKNIINVFIPITITIIVSELIRRRYMIQDTVLVHKGKKINPSWFLILVMMTLIDLLVNIGIYDLNRIDDFLLVVGFILFASISCNLLFNYMVTRYGSKGIIAYRLITTLPLYLVPIIPKIYILMRSFLRMFIPLILFFIFESIYKKKEFAAKRDKDKKNIIVTAVVFIILTLFVMLISCQFKYGLIVIGSKSMTGTIDKGDAIIYEKYEGQTLKKGQIIVFNYNGIKTVHRIVDIRTVNGQTSYITKGDANKDNDSEFRSADDIEGVVNIKIKYIGVPTLWFRSLFEK
ncbi:MAG: signal peptidase I [Bacilli bacterium]|nr:signal peptidase I [Bacilli bacterium]